MTAPRITQPKGTGPIVPSQAESEKIGHLGNHTVKIIGNPPFRLDKIGHNSIPFQGFTNVTKLNRAQEGVLASSGNLMQLLQRPNGKFEAAGIVKALNTIQTFLDKQVALEKAREQSMDELVLRGLSTTVESMSNTELQGAYSTLLCQDMDTLKAAIEHEARTNPKLKRDMMMCLSNLMNLEALIVSEVSRRIAVSTLPPEELEGRINTLSEQYGGTHTEGARVQASHGAMDMQALPMAAMFNTVAANSMRHETESAKIKDFQRTHGMEPVQVRQIGDMLRSKELTINISASVLFGEDAVQFDQPGEMHGPMPIEDPNFQLKNMFSLKQEGIIEQRRGYEPLRQSVEDSLFPELHGHIQGNERPIYAAINHLDFLKGACPSGYGSVTIVLKEEVKKAATFTVGDTFDMPVISYSPAKEQLFIDTLLSHEDILTEETSANLRDPDSALRKQIHTFLSKPQTTNLDQAYTLNEYMIMNGISFKASTDNSSFVQKNIIYQVFGDHEATHKKVADFDHIENLLPTMTNAAQISMGLAVTKGINTIPILHGAQYIEAQLQKPIIISRDVEEIRILDFEVTPEAQNALKEWSKNSGVKVTFITSNDTNSQSSKINQEINQEDIERIKFMKPEIRQMVDNTRILYQSTEKITQLLEANPKYGEIKELLDGRPFLSGAAQIFYNRKLEDALATGARNIYSLSGMIDSQANDACQKFLNLKLELLSEANKLEFETIGQKKAFMKWVQEAGAIKSVDEMKMIYEGAQNLLTRLYNLADSEDHARGLDCCKQLAAFIEDADKAILKYANSLPPGSDFGADDKSTELNRMGFMAVALLKNSGMTTERQKAVCAIFDRPEVNMLRIANEAIQNKISGNASMVSEDQDTHTEVGRTALMHIFTSLFERSITEITEVKKNPLVTLDITQLPDSFRSLFTECYPHIGGELFAKFPRAPEMRQLPAIPVSRSPDSLPKTLADRRRFLLDCLPSYHEHERTFDRADYHGRTHACRTFILANVLGNILKERGVQADVNLLALAAAGHDIGRTSNGTDINEGDSANITAAKLLAMFPGDYGEDFINAFKECITSTSESSSTIEAWLLHCADSLDYGRVGEFNPDLFPFLKTPLVQGSTVIPPDPVIRKKLEAEITLLQKFTHPMCAIAPAMNELANANPVREIPIQQIQLLQNAAAEEIQSRTEHVTDEQIMDKMENLIRMNPQMFPVLNQYYHD